MTDNIAIYYCNILYSVPTYIGKTVRKDVIYSKLNTMFI